MPAHEMLSAWESFYVIVGSSAGALTGLQFVVITLVSESQTTRSTGEIAAFGTPTIVHFCLVLLIAVVISSPWPTLAGPAVVLGVCGVFGVTYAAVVATRARHTVNYRAVLEDWIWHVVLPLAAYVTLVVAAANLPRHGTSALFAVAASSVMLVLIGIHNAWDAVTYVTVGAKEQQQKSAQAPNTPMPSAVESPSATG